MKEQINKCISEIASLASLAPEIPATASMLPSFGHKAAFVVLCTMQLGLCLYTAFFISKRRGTVKNLYYDVKDVTESVEEAYYLINELNARVAQSGKEGPQSPIALTESQKELVMADMLAKLEDRVNHPLEAIKTRLQNIESNVANLQRATSSFNPRAPPYRGGKPTRDPRSNENYRGNDFRSFDSRNNESRFPDPNYSADSRPWKPWSRTGGRSHPNSTPNSAPIEFYGEKRSYDKMEWSGKPNEIVTVAEPAVVAEPTPDVIQRVALPVATPAAPSQPAPKLVVNCTPQMSKKIIIKAGDREYDLASAEGREQWSSVAKRNISKAITLPSHVQAQDSPSPPLAPLRTATTRSHTIELSPLTSTYSSETDGTEVSKISKPKEEGAAAERRATGLDNYIESVDSPQSPNASLGRALQLKLEENVSKDKESSGGFGDADGGEKKPYRRLFIPGRGWVSARRIAMEKAQEEGGELPQGGLGSELGTGIGSELGSRLGVSDVSPTAGENAGETTVDTAVADTVVGTAVAVAV